ncbi:MAG: ABC transporter permease [Gemmatimonadota bacterium]
METLGSEIRFGFRALLKQPGSALVSVLILALGIGLSTSMFSIIYGVYFRGLEVPGADRVALVHWQDTSEPEDQGRRSVASQDFRDLRERQRSFEGLGAYWQGTVNVSGTEGPERFDGAFVTSNVFDLLGVEPVLGRTFVAGEDAPGGPPTVVLGYRVWRERYGGDPGVLGRTARVNGEQGTIVGVMPDGFMWPADAELWVSMDDDPSATERWQGRFYSVFGRLADGVSWEQAELDVARVARELEQEHPDTNEGMAAGIWTFVESQTGPELTAIFGAMMVAVLCVLLVACANVANLLLARAALRTREAGVRVALGASRLRVMAPFFAEAFVLAATGAALGTVLAYQGIELFDAATSTATTGRPYFMTFHLDLPALAFVVGLTLLTTLAAGAAPALQVSRSNVNEVLKDESRGSSSLHLGRLSRGLVIAEVALSCALLVGAGLMTRSIVGLASYEYPFDPDAFLTARIGLFEADYPEPADRQAFWEDLLRGLDALPEVASVGLTNSLPGLGSGSALVRIEGVEYPEERDIPRAHAAVVSPGFFELMEAPLVEGEDFGPQHTGDAEPVAIVNESFAARFWPGESALGRRIRLGTQDTVAWKRVVGVVPDLQMEGLQPAGYPGSTPDGFYLPLAQGDSRFLSVAVRPRAGRPTALTASLRSEVLRLDPHLPIYDVAVLRGRLDESGWFYGVFGTVFIVFGAAALFMASIGLYGVLAFSVSRRVQELGIRMALGAGVRDVTRLVVKQGAVQTGIGLAIGLVMAWFMSRAVGIIAFRVDPRDPVVFGGVVAVIVLVSLLASVVPARRATCVEPAVALRGE